MIKQTLFTHLTTILGNKMTTIDQEESPAVIRSKRKPKALLKPKSARRTIEEQISYYKEKARLLEEKKKEKEEKLNAAKTKKKKLTKNSPGLSQLLIQLDNVAKENEVKVADVIKAVARLRRTGLVIEHKSTKYDEVMGM